jgi:ATP-binding cassette subfamily B protein
METPYWALGYEEVAQAKLREVAAAVPRTMAVVVRWSWRADPRLTLLTGVLQLVTGVVQALGLLATVGVFARLLAEGPTPERVVAALPALAVVVVAYAGRGLLDAILGATQAALLPRVQRVAEDELYVALIGLDLVAFDEPDFIQLVNRVTEGAPDRVRFAVQRSSDLTALAVSMVAAVLTAGLLHPLLAPTVLLAAAPQAWAQVKGAQLAFDSWVRRTSRARRLEVVNELIAQRENAAEVRAFTTQEVLIAEHRRIADDLMAESERVAQQQNRTTTIGRTIAGLGTALGYVVLGLLLYAAAMPLALAGTAALAMRAAASAIINSMFQVSQLYESGFTLELYRTLIADAGARSRPRGQGLAADPPRSPWTVSRSAIPAKTKGHWPTCRSRCAAARSSPSSARTGRGNPRSPSCSPGSTCPRPASSPGTASTPRASTPGRCTSGSPSCCRTPCTGR